MVIYRRPYSPENPEVMLSFAQCREDVLIDRVFRKAPGFFIDVGAAHPVIDSVTKYFSLGGWRGINIEPRQDAFQELVRDRPGDINLPCAAGRARGRALLHVGADPNEATISPAQLDLVSPARRVGEQRIEVEVRTLADICEEFVTGEIDFMKIDAEGAEGDVIAGADWKRFRPRLLVIEATKPWSSELVCQDWEPCLLSQGYSFGHFDGINRYYLRHEDAAFAEQLSVPVNVLDSFITFRELQLRQEIEGLKMALQRQRSCPVPASPFSLSIGQ